MGVMGFVLKEMEGTKFEHFGYVVSSKVDMFLGIILCRRIG